MAVTKESLQVVLRDFWELDLTDEEIERLLPAVRDQLNAVRAFERAVDVTRMPPAFVLRAALPGEGGKHV